MDKDTEVEVGEIVASSSEYHILDAEREDLFRYLGFCIDSFIEQVRSKTSYPISIRNKSISELPVSEGRFYLLWQNRDEDTEIDALLASRYSRDP